MADKIYKTEPLACYQKAKELRSEHFQDIMTAREKGKLLISGSATIAAYEIPAGLGDDVVTFVDDAYAVNVATNADFSAEARAACEARGYGRDICGYTLNYAGSMFLDRFLFGGRFPKPDLVFCEHNCDARGKWSEIVADHFSVPIFLWERPCGPAGQGTRQRIDYIVAQFNEAIEWMERVTGRKYDDEKLLEATRNCFRSAKLWGEIFMLNRTIPAPIDARALISLMAIYIWRRHQKEGVAFLEMLRDEVKYRVENEIAASARERCRLMIEDVPPFLALPLFHWTQDRYGMVWLGTLVYTGVYGELEMLEDGTVALVKTPEERRGEFRNREDALRAIAESSDHSWLERRISYPVDVNPIYIAIMKCLRADGVVLHMNKACPANAASVQERKLAFQDAGIPVTMYESTPSVPSMDDVGKLRTTLKIFLEELMGLNEFPSPIYP
jgi:benzoyl-CoA reductase subunit B